MQNMIAYAGTELRTFLELPFSEVDSLVLAQLSYEKFERLPKGLFDCANPVTIAELNKAELFHDLFTGVRDEPDNRALFAALAASPRFREIRICAVESRFVPEQAQQFFAMTCMLPDGSLYLAYRGTDSTLVGWKEDVNMAFLTVPSQQESARYLSRMAARFPAARLRVGGHSKGGNLAVYAAMCAESGVQARLLAAYSHDGPGFREGMLQSDGYRAVCGRVYKTLPQSSVIGMLLEHQEVYRMVVSNRFGLMQHDPFSWEIDGSDFHMAEQLTDSASLVNETLHDWICTLSDEKRALFVDALFSVLESTGATTTKELSAAWLREAPAVLAAIKGLDKETTAFLLETLKQLGALYMHNMNVRIPRLPALGHKPGAQADKSEQREKTAEN